MDELKEILNTKFLKLEKRIDDSEKSVKKYFDNKFNLLEMKITELEKISLNAASQAKEALTKSVDIEQSIALTDEKLSALSQVTSDIEDKSKTVDSLVEQVKVLSARLEDQTNRACRKTIIIRGVKEDATKEKTWEDTKKIVGDIFYNKCNVTIDPDEQIENAHRGKNKIKKI